jgi:hypothetical protein
MGGDLGRLHHFSFRDLHPDREQISQPLSAWEFTPPEKNEIQNAPGLQTAPGLFLRRRE